jgi:hypothetical protein
VPFDLGRYTTGPIVWKDAVRIQPWRHPEAEIWSELAGEGDLPGLLAILRLTEPDTFLQLGAVDRLSGLEWMDGEGAGRAMPAFTFGGPGCFNDATFGCFYAALELEAAVAETVYHQEKLTRATSEPSMEIRMRALRADLDAGASIQLFTFPNPPELYHPDDYGTSRDFGAAVRAAGLRGIAYESQRRPRGRCGALFYPEDIRRCTSAEALAYLWVPR